MLRERPAEDYGQHGPCWEHFGQQSAEKDMVVEQPITVPCRLLETLQDNKEMSYY